MKTTKQKLIEIDRQLTELQEKDEFFDYYFYDGGKSKINDSDEDDKPKRNRRKIADYSNESKKFKMKKVVKIYTYIYLMK